MPTATISLSCPTMPVDRYAFRHARNAAEPMTGTITFDDGSTVTVPDITIPETEVDRVAAAHWRVRPCVGVTPEGAPVAVKVELPAQDVTGFDLETFTLTAQSITAPVLVIDGSQNWWRGSVTWPDSPVSLFPLQAEPVTATGTLEKQ